MLFNSREFIFVFLPAVWAIYYLLLRQKRLPFLAIWFLALASLMFYGWWDYRYVPLLMASVVFNYACGLVIASGRIGAFAISRRSALIVGIAGDLALLAYFKYTDFFLSTLNAMALSSFAPIHIVLPLGISFFTFTQIAFLVDTYRGLAKEYRFSTYLLFVTYFPHLIAGPILHHKEMIPQFTDVKRKGLNREGLGLGLSVFAIGLAEKVLLADPLAGPVSAIFEQAKWQDVSFIEAWVGALGYTLQLYFDFAGYCDMAIGLSLLFGVKLPINFNSPYKALSIVDFWRRWHMTLSRFLRDYLYIALGGNRLGRFRRYVNLMITMLLGGLWHGASWTFVLWGGLHGCYLIVNHGWNSLPIARALQGRLWWQVTGWFITFLCVVVAWVVFRAETIDAAWRILTAMTGGGKGIVVPGQLASPRLTEILAVAQSYGVPVKFGFMLPAVTSSEMAWIPLLLLFVWFMPNIQDICGPNRIALAERDGQHMIVNRRFVWRPSWSWAIGSALLWAVAVLCLDRASQFLYYQF